MISNINKKKAHGDLISDDGGQITALTAWNSQIFSLGADGNLRIWNQNLELKKEIVLFSEYMLCMKPYKNKLYIGNGKGQIMVFNEEIELLCSIKIGYDCISSLEIYGDLLYCSTFDGIVAVLQLQNHSIFKKFKFDYPIEKVKMVKEDLYATGVKSYLISYDNKIKEIDRVNDVFEFENQLFGLSFEKGLHSITGNINTYSPCEIVAVIEQKIIGFFDQGVTIFERKDNGISWRSHRIQQFSPDYALRHAIVIDNKAVVVGGQDSFLYKICFSL